MSIGAPRNSPKVFCKFSEETKAEFRQMARLDVARYREERKRELLKMATNGKVN
jgi:hypothetical protein